MTRIVYQKEQCSRCGGSGEYSYCQTYGTTCFKCHGSGKQLTKAARNAKAAIEAQLTRYHRQASELTPGMLVDMNTGSARRWQKVESITDLSKTHGANFVHTDPESGAKTPWLLIKATFGPGLQCVATQEIKVRFTASQWRDEIMPLARTLDGVTITETEIA